MSQDSTRFEAPGAGPWQLDAAHFDRPLDRYSRSIWKRGFDEGQAAAFAHAGWPAKGIVMDFVHGLPYGQFVPLMASPAPT